MLASLQTIRPLLACPRCRGKLSGPMDAMQCVDPACGLSFPAVGRWPVLVDFERSILSRDLVLATGARTLAPRVGGLLRRLRNLLFDTTPTDAPRMLRLRELLARDPHPTILTVGGGTVGPMLQPFYDEPGVQMIGFDIYASPATQLVADAHHIPLEPGSVDAVIIVAVLEHVLDPGAVVAEIHRVLKPQGAVYAETPFLQHVHEGPYDFTRFTASGHRYLFREFEEVLSGLSGGPGTQLVWSLESFVRAVTRSRLLGRITRLLFHWLRFADALVPERHSIDGASAFWFLGTKSEVAVAPKEMVAYYRGAQR
ncbi:MAG TPA: methyltransferase domain-containing protein [Thermoanaerobaculia bacterium]|nr:methyltransferase domain-containing protein [Thermoanaerobaculia bacterium]